MNEERNKFDEEVFKAISSLGALMTTTEISECPRTLLKINRFRNYLISLNNIVINK